ncbi:acyl-CoA/acyl-ACP dehydrogenase [bacterium]|nr:acyl-CoA/acyl-ACP dehydrogenase [bacterium]
MDLALTKDQEMIQKSSREFFKKECPYEKTRQVKVTAPGYDKKMWKKMVNLGYLGIIFPEQYGGSDGEFIELTLLMEEVGRAIAPSPFFSTMQCGLPILTYGSEEQKEVYLPGIAEKGDTWSLAHSEQSGGYRISDIQLKAVSDGDGFVLNGVKLFVPYASTSSRLLVSARTSTNNISVFMVDPKTEGIRIETMPTIARDDRGEVSFVNVRVPKSNILGDIDNGDIIIDTIIQQSSVLKAAEMYGGARAAFNLTVNYTKERKQFNRKLASFQVVQHRLVNLLTDIDGLKYLVYKAAWSIATQNPDRILNSAAKIKANSVHTDVCRQGMYLHGAIGWTEEMDIGLYHLQTRAMNFDGGGSDLHREQIACELEKQTPLFKQVLTCS